MKFENVCQLRERDHKYLKSNGEPINLPSATALVNLIYRFPIEQIDKEVLRMGQERGNHLHSNMEIYLTLGINDTCCAIKSHQKYFSRAIELWEQIKKNLELEEVFSELPLYNEKYCGTIDVLAYSNKLKSWIILDFKTTSWGVAKTEDEMEKILAKESLQLYLYSQLLSELKINNFYIINPNKSQCYQLDSNHIDHAKRDYEWLMNYLEDDN